MVNYQIIRHQHLFEQDRYFNECHASTIVQMPEGRMAAAWFAGTEEKAPDVDIWCCLYEGGSWSEPFKVAGAEGVPCWNPVLYYQEGTLSLFYKVGPEIPRWQTMIKRSYDFGHTWTEAEELVLGDFGGRGPVKNKPIRTPDGVILAPASTEEGHWICFVDRSEDGGRTWERSADIPGGSTIQPSLWIDEDQTVHMLMRSSEGHIFTSSSTDQGKTWLPAVPTDLPNNNCGLDLTKLPDGRLVLVCNPVSGNWAARSPIAFYVSEDNGKTWSEPQILDHVPCDRNIKSAEFSYPAVVSQGNDIFLTYTWKRKTIAFWQIHFPEARR